MIEIDSIRFSIIEGTERDKIYNLWYRVYYQEMGRNKDIADHDNLSITDNIEPNSQIIALKLGSEIIGSSRINIYPDDSQFIAYYEDLYGLEDLHKQTSEKIAIITRYMVLNDYRNEKLGLYLALASINYCMKNKIKWIVMDCSPAVYDYFENLGFVNHTGISTHKDYGEVRVMKFNVFSEEKFRLNNKKNQNFIENLVDF